MLSDRSGSQKGSATTRPAGLWRSADFLKFWAGETISLLGSQVTTLALPLTAVIVFKASAIQVGLLYAAGLAPFLLITLLVGVWVDHHQRRPILLVSNAGRAILLGLVPLLAFMGWLRIEYLYVIAFLVGCLTVFFYLAYQAFLPTLVGREHLVEGNSRLSASQSLAEIGGPGLAGLLVQLVGAPLAIVVDALSFCVSALSLLLIHTPESVPEAALKLRDLPREIAEGFRLTFGNRYLLAFAGEAASYNLCWQVILTIFVLYAVRDLHFNAGLIGILFAVGSVGALLGSLLTGSVARHIGLGLTIIGAAVLGDLPLLMLPFINGSTTGALGLLGAAFFVQGLGITGCNVHVDSIRQALIPDRMRGRANACYRLLTSGALPLGALLGGLLGSWIGLRSTLLVGALGLLSTCLWVVFSPVRKLRTLSTMKAGEPVVDEMAEETCVVE